MSQLQIESINTYEIEKSTILDELNELWGDDIGKVGLYVLEIS